MTDTERMEKISEICKDLDDDTINALILLNRRVGTSLSEIVNYWFYEERDWCPKCCIMDWVPDVEMCEGCFEVECPDKMEVEV